MSGRARHEHDATEDAIRAIGLDYDSDKLVLLELWKDQAALDAHAKLQAQRPALPDGLRLGAGEREWITEAARLTPISWLDL